MRAALLAVLLGLACALLSGCRSDQVLANAEHESLYGPPPVISYDLFNWNQHK
jgi:hypothetical protein